MKRKVLVEHFVYSLHPCSSLAYKHMLSIHPCFTPSFLCLSLSPCLFTAIKIFYITKVVQIGLQILESFTLDFCAIAIASNYCVQVLHTKLFNAHSSDIRDTISGLFYLYGPSRNPRGMP